jgi:hypothetical protein
MALILRCGEIVTLIKFPQINFFAGLRTPKTQGVSGISLITGDHLIESDRDNFFGFQPARMFTLLLNSPAETNGIPRLMAFKFHGSPYSNQ